MSLLAGAAFIAGEVLNRVDPDIDSVACATGPAYVVNLIDLLKYGLSGIALLLLVEVLGDQLSPWTRVVGRVAAAGFVTAGVANGVEHCAHIDALGLVYVLGLLVGIGTSVAFGVLLAKSRAVPAWMGWGIVVGVLGFLLAAEQGGAIVIGIAWMAVSFGLVTLHPTEPLTKSERSSHR